MLLILLTIDGQGIVHICVSPPDAKALEWGGPCLFNSLSSVVRYKCACRVENVTRKCNYLLNDSIHIARVSVSDLQTWSQ